MSIAWPAIGGTILSFDSRDQLYNGIIGYVVKVCYSSGKYMSCEANNNLLWVSTALPLNGPPFLSFLGVCADANNVCGLRCLIDSEGNLYELYSM